MKATLRHLPIFATANLLVLVCTCGVLVSAQNAGGSAIAQSFQVDGSTSNFISGALVSTDNTKARTVQLATSSSSKRLAGVISQNPLVALSNGKNQVQVAISGTLLSLVSDINGQIRAGDKITASPIEGVGMLATNDTQIVGTAQASFSSKRAKTQTVKDHNGTSRTVHIGAVPLQVNISYYQAPTSTILPPVLQNLANGVAGRPVALVRILLCLILLLLAFASIGILIITSVRSGIISIGRNPLAAGAIRKGLFQVALAAVLILIFTLLSVYLLLTV
jgi:hypothetical protein